MATRGGVALSELSPRTLACRNIAGPSAQAKWWIWTGDAGATT
jgi:hypothetical protein